MVYKKEVQIKNEEILEKTFKEDRVPMFVQDFFLRIASRDARKNYYGTIKELFNWLIDNEYLEVKSIAELRKEHFLEINSAKITRFLSYLKDKKGIKLTTLNTKRNQLSSFWDYLCMEKIVDTNIVRNIKSEEFKPAKTNRIKTVKLPLPRDIEMLEENLSAIKNDFQRIRNLTIFRVLRGTGLRKSELIGLNMEDVVLDNLDERNNRAYVLVISKGNYDYTDEGKDIVYLTNDAILAFREWFAYRKTMNIVDKEAVFINRNGTRIDGISIDNLFRRYSDGLITPHMMRHEYATMLQRESGDSTFVQEQGRWRSPAIMTSVYDSGASRSMNVLDKL